MDKVLKKLIAVLLVITLAGANFTILGMYGITYALTDAELSGQTTSTQNSNVEFNAYFEGGGHTKTENIDNTTKLFVNVKVKNAGYLKNAEISLQDSNFIISGDVVNSNIQSIDKENQKIELKQLDNGSDVTLEIPISIKKDETVSLDYFAKETKAIFTGIYIDANGKEKNVSKEIVNKLLWHGENVETNLEAEVTKFVPYVVNNNYGVMLQITVKSSIKNNKMPIKNTQISLELAKMKDDTKPTSVNVIANSTKATNGEEDAESFSTANYTYDSTNNTVKINVSNKADQIMWLKDVNDEYLVNCIYEGKDIYDYANESMSGSGLTLGLNVQSKVELYNDVELESNVVEKSINKTELIEKKVGTIASFDMSVIDSIGKGQIYANYEATKKEETEYWVRYKSTISSASLTDSITFIQEVDSFLTDSNEQNPTTVSENNYAYNKKVKVSEKVFKKILGEEGTIDIYNSDNTKLETIDKASLKDEAGNYVVDISAYNSNKLTIITSKPVTEGNLIIDVEKAIKTNIDYSKTQMQTFTKMEMRLKGKASTSTVDVMRQFLLKETKSIAKVEISKKDLTTVVKNENVEIRATLDTSSINNALYKNPTLKIKLPSYISKVDLKNYDILMDNGLKIKGTPQVTTENGSPVINIELEGNQTEYTIGAEYKGTIIVLNTDLTVATLTPSNVNKIEMEFTNENNVSTNKKGTVETELNFVAPIGIVAANGISNYADSKGELLSISDKNETATISAYAKERTVTVKGTIINNYSNKIGNVILLGRFPTQGNKKIDVQEDLGSTFSTKLAGKISLTGIDSSKYTVYYSENANATKNITDSANAWTTNETENAKSYLVVTNGYEMEAGGKIEFAYNVVVPENIKHNNSVYEMYKVYYDNNSTIGTMAESKTSAIVGMTTGQGPELTAELSAVLPEGGTVREGQTVKMKVTVKNTGSMTANNVKVNVQVPKCAEYVAPEVLSINKIEPGKTEQVSYYLKIKDETNPYVEDESKLTEEEASALNFPKKIINKVTITADELTGEISSNEYELELLKGNMKIDMQTYTEDMQVLSAGDILEYRIYVENLHKIEELTNTIITIPLPQGTKYKSAVIKDSLSSNEEVTEGITYDESKNVIKVDIGTVKYLKFIVLKIEIQNFEGNISIVAKGTANDVEEHYSNVLEYILEKVNMKVSELTSTPKYVKEANIVTYKLTITNDGNDIVHNIKIVDELPKDLKFQKATYMYAGNEEIVNYDDNGKVEISINRLQIGEKIDIQLFAEANLLSDKNDKEVQNKMKVSARGLDEVTTNTVTNIIEYNEEAHKDNTDEGNNENPTQPTEKKYKITGTAWEDSNKNGKRDNDEKLLSNIEVMLLNKENNKIVVDADTNKQQRVTTGSNGQYEFNNVVKGEYIAIFLYDASKYSLTTYREKDVDPSLNSDVISINVTIDGKRTIAGTTDVINITDSNVRDIDIGLYSSEKFDLKLDKYISKITLTTPTIGTKVYDYDNSKLAKIEVLGSSLGKSSIAIEYKIVITNEGAIPGYAKKIVDYLPEGVGFNTELNQNWYLSDNGNVYNSSLANTVINPGESKELILILTKKITEDSLGKPINNNAEIYESYNEQGLSDMDSTPGNKVQDEDDISKADIILSIVTGKLIGYTAITLGVIALLGFGIFEIKKRVLNKKV